MLLLHGIGGGRYAWGDAATGTGASLRDAGFDVMGVDLPGYGASPLIDPLTIAAMAHAALACIEWAGHDRAIVLGHSMGGMVAQEMAVIAPQRIAALVLSGTSPAFGKPVGDPPPGRSQGGSAPTWGSERSERGGTDPPPGRSQGGSAPTGGSERSERGGTNWQQRFLAERLKPLNDGLGMAGLAPQLVRAMCAPHASAAAIEAATRLMATVPEATYRAALRALMGFDRRDNLQRLKMPVLLLAGELDPNAPPSVMQGMAQRIEGADYGCLPGVGHLANLEAPQAFVDAVVDFLRRAEERLTERST